MHVIAYLRTPHLGREDFEIGCVRPIPSFDRLVGRIGDWQSSQAGALTGGAP